jgi:AcrR family transcriptional regulator
VRTGERTTAKRRRYAARLPAPERREQLLEAAMEVVGERGYRGLTMEAVALRAGVTKPVVYDAFANRDDVMRALLDAEEQRAVAELLDAIGPVPPPGAPIDVRAFIIAAVGRALDAISARQTAYRLMLMQIEGTPSAVRSRVDEGRATIVTRVRAILTFATQGPDGTSTIDAELLALGLVAIAEQAAILLLTDPERFTPERFEASLRQLLGPLPGAAS